jgi:hypothetical protein
MYAKNHIPAPKYDYPFQKQQQISGSYIIGRTHKEVKFTATDIRNIEDALKDKPAVVEKA